MAGKYEFPGTGVTVTFAAASDSPETSFQVGDLWSFSTTAPTLSKGDVLAAARKVKDFPEEFDLERHMLSEHEARLCMLELTAAT